MRLLSLVALVTFVCSEVSSANTDKTYIAQLDLEIDLLSRELAADLKRNQAKRFLRRNFDVSDGEERGSPLNIGALGNLEQAAVSAPKDKLVAKFNPHGLRKQMVNAENGGKFKVNPELVSRVGRDKQRYDGDRRLLSCIVVSKPKGADGIGGDVLLITSSRPPPPGEQEKWILPKGGWEKDEDILASAKREAKEEPGVIGEKFDGLGEYNFRNRAGKPYRYYGYRMKADKALDEWAEDSRRRLWVSFDEAIEKLEGRPDMVHMVKRAKLQDFLEKGNTARAAATGAGR